MEKPKHCTCSYTDIEHRGQTAASIQTRLILCMSVFLLLSYFGLLVGVPGEGNGIIGNLLDVTDGVEALLVVSCKDKKKDFSC